MSTSVVQGIITKVEETLSSSQTTKTVVAVYGPQGSGKTTSTREAAKELNAKGIPTIAVSLDDYYKPYSKLKEIAHLGNPLLLHRGLPGTHDTAELLQFLKDFAAGKNDLEVPVYDKSLHSGAGDRAGNRKVPNDTQAILVEGWMIGFKPIGETAISSKMDLIRDQKLNFIKQPTLKDFVEIDTNLKAYLPIWDHFAALIKLEPLDMHYIYKWRLHQEHDLIKSTGQGMSDEEVKTFVDQYWSSYILYADTFTSDLTFYLNIDHKASLRKL